MGTAYVSKDGVHTIIININTKEASYIVNGVAGRQIATGTDEKGFESTRRTANIYFKEEYTREAIRIWRTSLTGRLILTSMDSDGKQLIIV